MNRGTGKLLASAALVAGTIVAIKATVRRKRAFDLRGRSVLLTGGTRGLGLELARQLSDQRVKLAICARDESELREAAEELTGRGAKSLFTGVCDVTDAEQVRLFVEQARSAIGPIDVLINNAGIITIGPFESLNRDDFRQSFATHVSGPLEMIRCCLPDMRARGGGRIVNIASLGGKQPIPHMAAYVASKHALVGLSETLRAELQGSHIYVTLVCPGVIRTGSPWNARFKGDAEAEYAWFAAIDNVPGLAIATERLARRIIDAFTHGDAELITPWDAKLASAMHGLLGGWSVELSALIAKLLPKGTNPRLRTGRQADVEQLPTPLQREQQRNAADFNQQ